MATKPNCHDNVRFVGRFLILVCLACSHAVIGCGRDDSRLPSDSSVGDLSLLTSGRIRKPYRIELTGSDYRWRVRYPGLDGVLGNKDDVTDQSEIHLPADTEIVLELRSTDYVYIVSIPELKLKEIAAPTLEFRLRFQPLQVGRLVLEGDDFCGDTHPELKRTVMSSLPWLMCAGSKD
jgi:heme/copper-type cytochrome/quinol oxidase subunit 2